MQAKGFQKIVQYLVSRLWKNIHIVLILGQSIRNTWGNCSDFVAQPSFHLGSSSREQTQTPCKHKLSPSISSPNSLVHKTADMGAKGLGSSWFVSRAVGKVGDNFHPVLSWEELEAEFRWCSTFELLGHISTSTWMEPDTVWTKCSCQWPLIKPVTAPTELMRWEHETSKSFVSSLRLPAHWAVGGEGEMHRQTNAVCSVPLRSASSSLPGTDEIEIHAVWAWREKRWCRTDLVRKSAIIKTVSEKELKS